MDKLTRYVSIMALLLVLGVIGFLAVAPAEAPVARDTDALVYLEAGAAKQVVASGGEIEVQSGGIMDVQSGATFNTDADITLENGETIGNGTDGTMVLTADTVTTTAALGVATDLTVINDASVGGSLTVVGKLISATIALEAEANDCITATIQFKDGAGTELATTVGCMWYLSQDAAGAAIADGAPSGGIAIVTDGLLIEWTADLSGWVVSEADGDIDVFLEDNGADTFYIVLVMPDGSLVVSDVITFGA